MEAITTVHYMSQIVRGGGGKYSLKKLSRWLTNSGGPDHSNEGLVNNAINVSQSRGDKAIMLTI